MGVLLTDEDGVSEFTDSAVDIYNGARLNWLADDLSRVNYMDDAKSEGLIDGSADILEQIGVGQYVCIEQMARIILDAWLDNKDDAEASDDD